LSVQAQTSPSVFAAASTVHGDAAESHDPGTSALPEPETMKLREKQAASAFDAYVGQRLQIRRMILGMSQTELAAVLGVTFQQIQKYERGMDRISANTLHELAKSLNVPIKYFHDGAPMAKVGALSSADLVPKWSQGGQP
jgi:DNA-binding XRE family transcriptional regulator